MTISKGYNSDAVSVLAAGLGYRDAITYATDELGYDDSGKENAAHLGLNLVAANQFDFHELPGHPEAEFCASNPSGAGMAIACLSQHLEGRILLKGDMGDFVWSEAAIDDMPGLRWPQIRALATTSMNEFRLRAGTLIFDVPAMGAVHCHEFIALVTPKRCGPGRSAEIMIGPYHDGSPRRLACHETISGRRRCSASTWLAANTV